MEQKLKELHEDVFATYGRLVQTLSWLDKQLKSNVSNAEYCADAAFAMKELNKLINDMGIEIRRKLELAETIVTVIWIRQSSEEPIRTDHCTATVQLKMQPAMPKKDSLELIQLLEWLGIKENQSAVRLHWPTLCDIVTKRIEDSQPLPPGIDPEKLYSPKGYLTFYKRKEVYE